MPNLYTSLSVLPLNITVLDLKDAFFSFLEPSKARTISPLNGMTEGLTDELTRSRIPQGFRNELTIFDDALHQDLVEYRAQHPHLTFLQYVDDVLVAADGQEACMVGTECLLQTLG